MPGHTRRGFVYPLVTDPAAQLPELIAELSEQHDRRIEFAFANVTATISAGGATAVQVTFPPEAGDFAEPPEVFSRIAGFVTDANRVFIRMVDQITTTGFRITLANEGGSQVTVTNLPIRYMAIRVGI